MSPDKTPSKNAGGIPSTYKTGDHIGNLVVKKVKRVLNCTEYYFKCKCGAYCSFFEKELPKKNCGGCYQKYSKGARGRPEMFSEEYKTWRKKVYGRDRHRCVCCNSKYKLNAHHLNGWAWAVEERYSIYNGVTLCGLSYHPFNAKHGNIGCHDLYHQIYGKGSNTKEEFDFFSTKYYNKNLEDIV